MTAYLKLKGNLLYVRLRVPADARWAFHGKSEVWRPTGTADRRAASIKAHAYAAAFKAEVERARGRAPTIRSVEDDPLIRLAMEWRGALVPLEGPMDEDDLAAQAALSATQDAAIEAMERLPQQDQRDTFAAVALHRRTPLATLVDQWGEHRGREVAPKTRDMDVVVVRRFVKAFPLAGHVSRAAVARWIDDQREEKSGATLQRETTGLRQFWQWLGQRGVFDPDKVPDPFKGLTFKDKRNGSGTTKRKPFKPAEVASLFRAAKDEGDHDLVKAIAIAAYTGARIEEIASAEAPSHGWLEVKDTSAKTEASIRRIPITTKLAALVTFPKTGRVFPDLEANQYGDFSGAIGKRFGRLKARLGHGEEKTFHSIRHTVVSLLDDAGVPPHVVAALVGHERGDFTGRVYSGAELRKLVKGAAAKLRYPKPL